MTLLAQSGVMIGSFLLAMAVVALLETVIPLHSGERASRAHLGPNMRSITRGPGKKRTRTTATSFPSGIGSSPPSRPRRAEPTSTTGWTDSTMRPRCAAGGRLEASGAPGDRMSRGIVESLVCIRTRQRRRRFHHASRRIPASMPSCVGGSALSWGRAAARLGARERCTPRPPCSVSGS